MKIKMIFAMLFTFALFMSNTSCDKTGKKTTDSLQQKQTEQSLGEANRQIGMPAIVNFQERKLFKQILELRDQESLITYCYLMNEMSGTIGQFLGKGIGYGIPAATQFTNPDKLIDVTNYGIQSYQSNDGMVIAQADPNGLFMPTATSATWYMLLDGDGVPHPVYIEPLIIVSPIKLH